MAKPKKGILDNNISGSIGNVVFSSRNGVPYIRAKPAQYRDAKSPAQLQSRMRLSLISGLLKRFKAVISMGFRNPPPGKSSRDVAFKTNSLEVIVGEYPDLKINYSAFKISAGSLHPPLEVSAVNVADKLEVAWSPDRAVQGAGSSSDRLMLILYDQLSDSLFSEQFIAKRSEGHVSLLLPEWFTKTNHDSASATDSDDSSSSSPETNKTHTHLWLYFISPDGQQLSDSTYVALGVQPDE